MTKQQFDALWQRFRPPLFLAPMAGATDFAARSLAKEKGADALVTEMISAKAITMGNPKTFELLPKSESEAPIAVQLFGHEPEVMQAAARSLMRQNHHWLDINMGCPVPKIVGNGEGSALLLKPELAYDLVAALKEVAPVVTVKMRIGWQHVDTTQMIAFAKILENAGADAITVHGRTRSQYYSGQASRQAIKAVVKSVQVPVIANGDITDGQSALTMWQETGAQGLMIGRASQGNPWIFTEVQHAFQGGTYQPPSNAERKKMIMKHAALLEQDKGSYIAFREMRKHMAWYSKGLPGAAKIRSAATQLTDSESLKKLLDQFL